MADIFSDVLNAFWNGFLILLKFLGNSYNQQLGYTPLLTDALRIDGSYGMGISLLLFSVVSIVLYANLRKSLKNTGGFVLIGLIVLTILGYFFKA